MLSVVVIGSALALAYLVVVPAAEAYPARETFLGPAPQGMLSSPVQQVRADEPSGRSSLSLLPPGTAWELVFGDEFEGETLDSSKWVTCFPWGGESGCGSTTTPLLWYQPENAVVSNGTLKLVADNKPFAAPDGKTYPYTSGMITTSKLYADPGAYRFTFTTGYIEMRAKLPPGQGLWPAFWTLPPEGKWPPEIDVMEFLGHETNTIHMHYHYLDGEGVPRDNGGSWTGPDFTSGWHLFAVEWNPDAIIWYIDGIERRRYEGPYIAAEPMYLIANLQVGGSWPGDPDPSTPFPSVFEIDFIHVYKPTQFPPGTFTDVPLDHPYYAYIEALYQAGYTAGCNTDPLQYCPDATMNRAESAVFVERGIHSTSYSPPMPTTQVFADLALDSWAAGWVDGLWDDGYTAGCGTDPLIYCPWQGHTRAEGAVFYLRMLHGANFVPPDPIQPTFSDVPLDAWYARWAEAAYADGLIPPCQTAPALRFCPDDPLSRGLAAYMMVQAKHLPVLPPSGLYHSCWPANQSCLGELQIMHDGGFTYTINYSDFDYDIKTILAYASKLESLGMKTFWDMSRPNYAQGSIDPQYVIDRVNAVKGSPATAGYYVGDEFNTTATDVEWISSIVRQADPDPAHRTLFIHFYQIPDCMVVARPYSVPHVDALGLDLYAFANDRQSDDVAFCSKAGQEWDDAHDKDWVVVLQSFRGTDYGMSNDFPSRERMRLERDLALQNGRPLVVFWWWYGSAQQTGHWDDLVWAANGK